MSRFRNICFTLNNYSKEEEEAIKNLPCKYIVVGKEVGAVGATPHLQGYIELNNQVSLKQIKVFNSRLHVERRNGTAQQAADYCKKEGNFYEKGTISNPGKRTDLIELKQLIEKGTPRLEILTHPAASRNLRWVNDYLAEYEKTITKTFRRVSVFVLWGAAGCGKTRIAREMFPDIFTVNCGESFPFNGYDGEKAILLDDFYGNIKYHEILRILDGHQYRVNIKGAFRYAQWVNVIITSNQPPEDWYTVGLTEALSRRINKIIEF